MYIAYFLRMWSQKLQFTKTSGFHRYFRFHLYWYIAHSILNRFLYHQVKFRAKIITISYGEGQLPVWTSDRKSRLWRCIISRSTLYTLQVSSQSVHGCLRSCKVTPKMNAILIPPCYDFSFFLKFFSLFLGSKVSISRSPLPAGPIRNDENMESPPLIDDHINPNRVSSS